MAEEINPITGLPRGGEPTVSTTKNPQGERINMITGEPVKSATPSATFDQTMFFNTPYQDNRDMSKFRGGSISGSDYGVKFGQLQDWEEVRARFQTNADKWGNGLAKMGTTALGAVAENTLGVAFGIGELFSGGAYYDNTIGKNVDKMNEWMQENMPNYYSQEEQKMNTFQKLGTANFWADTVANGLGYSLGSIATMYLTGGMGPMTLLAKGGQKVLGAKNALALYNSSKAVLNGTKLGANLASKGAKLNRIVRAAQAVDAGLMMSLAEGSVEARQTQKDTYQNLIDIHMEQNGILDRKDIDPEDLREMEKLSYAAGNTNFISQMPILMATNLFMFGKQVAGYKVGTQSMKDVAFETATRKVTSKFANDTIWTTARRKLVNYSKQGLEEAFQEGYQFMSGQIANRYFTDGYKNNGHRDLSKALNEGLSETFGSQEGLESMLVGFLTGGIMSGGQSTIAREYSKRKKNAAHLANLINTGILQNSYGRIQTAEAQAAAAKRMQKAIKDENKQAFKDAQAELIASHALDALDQGGFEVLIERLEDSKTMDDAEFAKMYGLTDADGNAIDTQKFLGKSKAEIVDNHIKKLRAFEQVYDNVTESFPIPDAPRGAARALMNEQARKEADDAYLKRDHLRKALILNGAEVVSNTQRMHGIQKTMQDIINKAVRSQNLMLEGDLNLNEVLQEISAYETDRGEGVATEEGAQTLDERNKKLADKLNNIIEKVSAMDQVQGAKLRQEALDYFLLAQKTNVALNAYNTLSSNQYAQAQFAREEQLNKEKIQREERVKELKEGLDKAETTDDIKATFEGATNEEKLQGVKKFNELTQKENASKLAFKNKAKGTSLQEKLDSLKDIDKTKLSKLEVKGLNLAMQDLQEAIDTAKEEGSMPEQPPLDSYTEEQEGGPEVEEAFKDTNSKVEAIDDAGREFQIDGESFYNIFDNPLDAIKRDFDTGEVFAVVLQDEDGNTHTISGPESRVDEIAYAIIMSELYKMDGQPALDRIDSEGNLYDSTEAMQAAIKKKNLELSYKGKYGALTTPSLRYSYYRLKNLRRAAIDNRDALRAKLIAEGATKQDLKNNQELKDMSKEIRSVSSKLGKIKTTLKLRGEVLGPKFNERVDLEGQARDAVKETQELIGLIDSDISDLKAEIAELETARQSYKEGRDMDSYEAASRDLSIAKEKLQDKIKDKQEAQAMLKLDQEQLKEFNDEKENRPANDAEQAEQRSADKIEEQNNEREDKDRLGDTQEERTGVTVTPEDARVAALYEVLEGKDKEFVDLLRSKGQPAERVNQIIKNRASNYAAGNQLLQNYKAEDTLNNPEGKSLAELASAHSRLFGPKFVPAKTINDVMFQDPKLLEKYYSPGTSYDQAKQAILNYQNFANQTSTSEDVVEPVGKNEGSINKQVEDANEVEGASKAVNTPGPGTTQTEEGRVVAEFDLTQPMPPVEPGGTTFGESLQKESLQKTPESKVRIAAAPPQGDDLSMGAAFSDPTILDPINNRSRINVSEDGTPLDNLDPDERRELISSLRVGDEVTFEVLENDYFVENHKGKDTELEYIPIVYKKDGVIVGKLARPKNESELAEKTELVNRLRAGETLSTQISEVYAPNYNNARVVNGAVQEKYFYNPKTPFGQNPTLVFSTVPEGNPELRQFVTEDGNTTDLSTRRGEATNPGQVGFLIPGERVPGGVPTLSMGTTAFLNNEARAAVIDALRQGDFNRAQEIVASNAENSRQISEASSAFLEFGEFAEDGTKVVQAVDLQSGQEIAPEQPTRNYLVYKSPKVGELVRINKENLTKALQNKPFRLNFVRVNDGKYQTIGAPDAQYEGLKKDFIQDFNNFLENKKYNVDRDKVSVNDPYTSPVNPQRQYDSYKDYLFSSQELGELRQEGQGYNSILATDMVMTQGGLFHNPIVKFSKEGISGKNANQISENTTFAASGRPSAAQKFAADMNQSIFPEDRNREDLDQDCKNKLG